MKKGDIHAMDNGKVTIIYWMDSRVVKLITTQHNASTTTVQRWQKGGRGREEIVKPIAVCEYNQFMNGVDLMDQKISYYPCVRRTLKWVKKLFFYLLELSLHNAHVIYNHHQAASGGRKTTLLDFQLDVVRELCHEPQQHQCEAHEDEDGDYEDEDNEDEESQSFTYVPVPPAPRKDPGSRLDATMTVGYTRHYIAIIHCTVL
jgi:hypothetical protein